MLIQCTSTLVLRLGGHTIELLPVWEVWVEAVASIREAVNSYFSAHISEDAWDLRLLDGITFLTLSIVRVSSLSGQFSLVKIEQVVMSSDENKSPRSCGFNFSLIKAFWPLINDEVGILFDESFLNGTLLRSFSSYFLALIPKVESPFSLGDYRLILLLGCLYKMMAKVRAARLGGVIDSLVLENQSNFIKGIGCLWMGCFHE